MWSESYYTFAAWFPKNVQSKDRVSPLLTGVMVATSNEKKAPIQLNFRNLGLVFEREHWWDLPPTVGSNLF